jgi:chemotaxis regulatin CheY-phosphate phosphatase CheZ
MSEAVRASFAGPAQDGLVDRLEGVADRLAQEIDRLGRLQTARSDGQQLAMLQSEMEAMGRLIADTRAEIAGLLPIGTPKSCLTTASDELDSVVVATERAAVEIMVAAEHAQDAVQRLRAGHPPGMAEADLDAIDGAVMDIFMACSFQDLTGQRIRKVVQALSYIEQRVISVSALWRHEAELADPGLVAWETREDGHLLNGPSAHGLQQQAIDALLLAEAASNTASQDDVDALFS